METYTYAPLNLDQPSFRLIRLIGGERLPPQCELIHAFLSPEDLMDYEAVSYTWGHSEESLFQIEVLGKTIQSLTISPNVYNLLIDLRYPNKDRILWVDAICIDQNSRNTAERNHQVQQMATIYGLAQCVLVWLGTSTQEIDLTMTSLSKFQTFCRDMKWAPQDLAIGAWESIQDGSFQHRNGPIHSGIVHLFNRPWFRRVWILQEVRNARRVSIYCGKRCVSSALFSSAARIFGVKIDRHCQAVLDLMPDSPARSGKQPPHQDFWAVLRQFRKAKATIEHDNIYALLGLCPGKHIANVSYERPIWKVVSEVISHIVQYDVASLLLYPSIDEFQGDLDTLHERVLDRVVQNGYTAHLEKILWQHGDKINVTESTAIAAARNMTKGRLSLSILVKHCGRSIITKNVVKAAIDTYETTPSSERALDLIHELADEYPIDQKGLRTVVHKIRGSEPLLIRHHPKSNRADITKRVEISLSSQLRVGEDLEIYQNDPEVLMIAIHLLNPNFTHILLIQRADNILTLQNGEGVQVIDSPAVRLIVILIYPLIGILILTPLVPLIVINVVLRGALMSFQNLTWSFKEVSRKDLAVRAEGALR